MDEATLLNTACHDRAHPSTPRIVGDSRGWKTVLTQAAKVAPTGATVLITGESGTGKEVIARFIHRGYAGRRRAFVALNCAALPETLLESQLFGHEKGAFTGAVVTRAGSLEQAAGGVLFLDEVGEMSPRVQAKFLRVLQEREFQRLGGSRTLRADVRVVAATNRDLKQAMALGEFREDLYYRLHVFTIHVPPLRERSDDILPLARACLDEIGSRYGKPAPRLSRDARDMLRAYRWPGNVRELKNVLERAAILCEGDVIGSADLPASLREGTQLALEPETVALDGLDLLEVERRAILRALHAARNSRAAAARLLGLTRAQLYRRLRRHGIKATLTLT